MDQRFLAGVGNLLADEALWRARIHPMVCPRCGADLVKDTVAGRTACWCPRCQRR